jgi:hypothetical protein
MNSMMGGKMKEYLTAGTILMAASLVGFVYVAANVLSYPELAFVRKQTFLWFLLQCAASLFCGILGGYFLGIHKGKQKASGQAPAG